MPHMDLKYSSDLDINTAALFEAVERTLQAHDDNTGPCKCRAYPADAYHHSHCLIELRMFAKRERDAAFLAGLVKALEEVLIKYLTSDCCISVMISFSEPAYITREFTMDEKLGKDQADDAT